MFCPWLADVFNCLFIKPKKIMRPIGTKLAKPSVMRLLVSQWKGRVSPLFDVADRLLLFELDHKKIVQCQPVSLASRDPFERAAEMKHLGADVLICGAISNVLERTIGSTGTRIMGFVCGELEAVVQAFLNGRLRESRFQMPGHEV